MKDLTVSFTVKAEDNTTEAEVISLMMKALTVYQDIQKKAKLIRLYNIAKTI
jgi:hypothetical protein